TAYAARAHHLLAYVELERGNPADALELLDRGYALAVADGGSDSRGLFQLDRARALAALGRGDEAIELAMDVVGELRETRPEQAGRADAIAADVYRAQGDPDAALRYYELAAELVSERRTSFLFDV